MSERGVPQGLEHSRIADDFRDSTLLRGNDAARAAALIVVEQQVHSENHEPPD
jgi:hypothetical protein